MSLKGITWIALPTSDIRDVTKTDILSPARKAAMINLIDKMCIDINFITAYTLLSLKCDVYVHRSKEQGVSIQNNVLLVKL